MTTPLASCTGSVPDFPTILLQCPFWAPSFNTANGSIYATWLLLGRHNGLPVDVSRLNFYGRGSEDRFVEIS